MKTQTENAMLAAQEAMRNARALLSVLHTAVLGVAGDAPPGSPMARVTDELREAEKNLREALIVELMGGHK